MASPYAHNRFFLESSPALSLHHGLTPNRSVVKVARQNAATKVVYETNFSVAILRIDIDIHIYSCRGRLFKKRRSRLHCKKRGCDEQEEQRCSC